MPFAFKATSEGHIRLRAESYSFGAHTMVNFTGIAQVSEHAFCHVDTHLWQELATYLMFVTRLLIQFSGQYVDQDR